MMFVEHACEFKQNKKCRKKQGLIIASYIRVSGST